MRLALIEPDIAGNTGTILRLAACLGVGVDIVEPCGFPFSDKRLKRAGMDYAARADIIRHDCWDDFAANAAGRLVLLTTHATLGHHQVEYRSDDILMLGNESSGAAPYVHDAATLKVGIPMVSGMRSLNVAVAAGIVLAEALRQLKEFPG